MGFWDCLGYRLRASDFACRAEASKARKADHSFVLGHSFPRPRMRGRGIIHFSILTGYIPKRRTQNKCQSISGRHRYAHNP